jgi:hypothetical protein
VAGFAGDFCGFDRRSAVADSSDNNGRFVLSELSVYGLAALGGGRTSLSSRPSEDFNANGCDDEVYAQVD